ncbi:hypothetical protein ACWIEX_21750 [Bosea sp. NPDC055353]
MAWPASAFAVAVVGLLLLPAVAGAQARRIDAWSGIVLNCGPGTTLAWAERICSRLIGEMRSQAEQAKVAFVAVPVFADDATLDRRASDEGLDMFRLLHVRFDVSPPTGSLKSRDLTLVLRSLTEGSLAARRKDGLYKVLNHTPMIIVNEGEAAARAPFLAKTLTEAFFFPLLRPAP